MQAPKTVITRRMPGVAAHLLESAGFSVRAFDSDEPPARPAVLEAISGAGGVLTMLSDRVDDEFLDAAGAHLKIVANYAVGFDNIDLEACRRRSVRVSNTPGVLTEATADIAWALILACARRVIEGDEKVRTGKWAGWAPLELLGLELHGATLGVVGAGRIGTATARRAFGFGMRVLYSHPRRSDMLESAISAEHVELDRLLAESDIISLHIPMRPENRHLLDARRLALLREGAILINTARGAVVDETALVRELQSGRIRAGFDVYEHEPRLTPGLAELPNVVLLPHLGSGTTKTRAEMARMAAQSIIDVLGGGAPQHAVV